MPNSEITPQKVDIGEGEGYFVTCRTGYIDTNNVEEGKVMCENGKLTTVPVCAGKDFTFCCFYLVMPMVISVFKFSWNFKIN